MRRIKSTKIAQLKKFAYDEEDGDESASFGHLWSSAAGSPGSLHSLHPFPRLSLALTLHHFLLFWKWSVSIISMYIFSSLLQNGVFQLFQWSYIIFMSIFFWESFKSLLSLASTLPDFLDQWIIVHLKFLPFFAVLISFRAI